MSDNLIYAVFDSSGSNLEMGKSRLSRNLARTLVQLKNIHTKSEYTNINFELYTLNEQLQRISLDSRGDVPPFKSVGTSNLELLINFIDTLCSKDQTLSILFFSDLNYKIQDIECLSSVIHKYSDFHFLVLPIGLDADMSKLNILKTISFTPDNVLKAVDYAISFMLGKFEMPRTITQIKEVDEKTLFLDTNENEDEDSWE